MLLDPVNSVSEPAFYDRVAEQSFARTFLYLCYLALIFALAGTIALKVKVGPSIDQTFEWLGRAAPTMVFADGKLSSSAQGPVKLQHPSIPDIAFIIDTTRTTPVAPNELADAKIMAYVTSNTMYVRRGDGAVEPYDLTKGAAAGPQKPIQIDAAFYKAASSLLTKILYPLALVVIFVVFLGWKLVASLLFSVVALVLNAVTHAGAGYGALLNMTVYAQTAAIALQLVALFLPFHIPGGTVISLALTGFYLWLALKRRSPQQPA